ncbi:hypothetical protein [Clostridium sp. DL1XJH146]
MDYKVVLENQIKQIEEVQKQVLNSVSDGKEREHYTDRTLSLIANTSARVESLVNSITRLKKATIPTENSNG